MSRTLVGLRERLGNFPTGQGVWVLLGQGSLALSSLAVIPFLVRFLGPAAYGAYSLIASIIASLSFADMGMGAGSTRFGAAALAMGNIAGEAEAVWTAVAVNLVFLTLISTPLLLFSDPLLRWLLHVRDSSRSGLTSALMVAIAGVFAKSLATIFNTSQLIRKRLDINGLINMVGSIVASAAMIVAAVLWNASVAAVLLASTIVAVFVMITHFHASRRLAPALRRISVTKPMTRTLLAFGAPLTLSYAVTAVLTQADKWILVHYTSAATLGKYIVAFVVANVFSLGGTILSLSFFPEAARLKTQNRGPEMAVLFHKAMRWTAACALPLGAVLCCSARPFFRLWAGAAYETVALSVFPILVLGGVVNVIANVPYHLLLASARTRLIAVFHVSEIPMFLIAAVVLSARFGILGAALAYVGRVIVDATLMLRATVMDGIRAPLSGVRWPVGAAVVFIVPLYLTFTGSRAAFVAVTLAAALGVYGAVLARCGRGTVGVHD